MLNIRSYPYAVVFFSRNLWPCFLCGVFYWVLSLLSAMQVATGFMADEVGGCEALVHALLSVEPDIPNADDLILRAAVATSHLAEQRSLR